MAVLSDRGIRARLSDLLDDADPERIGNCEYYFRPGKLFPTGTDENGKAREIVDWTRSDLKAETSHPIRPGELLMLRTRERVSMPNDYCGLWYQTDHLSRAGLLLVNMSVVPPGYRGRLKCTFVNFGKAPVYLKPTEPVAKLLFLPLDQAAEKPSKEYADVKYDSGVADAARDAPTTFLKISDHAKDLETFVVGLREKQKELIKKDAQKAVVAALPLALLVIVLLTGATWFSNRFIGNEVDELAKKRAEQIEAAVDRQLSTAAGIVYSGTAAEKALLARIDALEAEVKRLSPSPAPK